MFRSTDYHGAARSPRNAGVGAARCCGGCSLNHWLYKLDMKVLGGWSLNPFKNQPIRNRRCVLQGWLIAQSQAHYSHQYLLSTNDSIHSTFSICTHNDEIHNGDVMTTHGFVLGAWLANPSCIVCNVTTQKIRLLSRVSIVDATAKPADSLQQLPQIFLRDVFITFRVRK